MLSSLVIRPPATILLATKYTLILLQKQAFYAESVQKNPNRAYALEVNLLPFLKNKDKGAGLLTTLMHRRSEKRTSVNPVIESSSHPDHDPALENAAQDLLNAIQSKSIPDLRDALKAAIQCCMPSDNDQGSGDQDSADDYTVQD